MFVELVMLSNHVINCHPLSFCLQSFLVCSIELAVHIRWPKYWSFSVSIGPSNEYSGLISFRIDWSDVLAFKVHFQPGFSFCPGSLPKLVTHICSSIQSRFTHPQSWRTQSISNVRGGEDNIVSNYDERIPHWVISSLSLLQFFSNLAGLPIVIPGFPRLISTGVRALFSTMSGHILTYLEPIMHSYCTWSKI